jgi:PAS domain S-box-containing protein
VPVGVTPRTSTWAGGDGVVAILRNLSTRRERRRALQETTRQLRGVLDTVEAAIVMKDRDGRYLLVNETCRAVLGLDDDADIVGKTDYDLFPDDIAEQYRADDQRVLDTEQTIQIRDTVPMPDGSVRTHLTLKSPVYDETGELYGICAVSTDVTAYRERERKHQQIIDRMTDAIIELDSDWRFTTVDEKAQAIYGMDADELLGENVWEVFPDAVETKFYEVYHEVMETREPDTLVDYYEGLDTWFEVRVYPADDGGLSIYFQDVTETKERERVYRELYETMADTTRSFEERVDTLLEMGCAVLGANYGTLSRVEGDDYVFEAVRAPGDSIQEGDVVPVSATNCERVAATERTLVLANVAQDAPELTGKAGYEEWGIACYLGAPVFVDGEVYGTFCFYDDQPRAEEFSDWEVTLVDLMSQWVSYELTRKRNRERLERQNERLQEFASIVSHDLRNPLNVAEGRLELARAEFDSDDLEDVAQAHDRMRALIDDILTLARLGENALELETVSLPEAIDACWSTVDTADATIRLETDATVRADRSMLYQLLENLLRNAVEHVGPDVTITVGDLENGFFIADDGPGIPSEDRAAVFESGYSTSRAGTGFGLRIVEQLADAHGWDVEITESADGGARFEFTGVDVIE